MFEKVKKWCDGHELLQQGDAVLIACSGGPDSLALTDVLLRLQPLYALRLAVAHLDHMFRGDASRADAEFVRNFCAARALPFFFRRADVPAYAAARKLSAEEAAREARYAFLREAAAQFGAAKIATGHHRGDQAETVLLHLLRGAGSAGIAGIRPASCGIIRPFLSVSRAEIEAYCAQRALSPRIDATNAEPLYLRNKIRLRLLPTLARAYNAEIEAALCRTAELVGAEHDFIRQCAAECWPAVAIAGEGTVALRRSALLERPLALRRELARLAVEKTQGHLRGIAFFHIERMLRFAAAGRSGAVLELPGGLRLRRVYDELRLSAEPASPADRADADRPGRETPLAVPGRTIVASLGVCFAAVLLSAYRPPRSAAEIVCDLDGLQLPLYARARRSGDRFHPIGMRGGKKLKDFFIDGKVERARRDQIPLVFDQRGIVWVAGMRQSEASRTTEATRNFLLLAVQKDVDEKENDT